MKIGLRDTPPYIAAGVVMLIWFVRWIQHGSFELIWFVPFLVGAVVTWLVVGMLWLWLERFIR